MDDLVEVKIKDGVFWMTTKEELKQLLDVVKKVQVGDVLEIRFKDLEDPYTVYLTFNHVVRLEERLREIENGKRG